MNPESSQAGRLASREQGRGVWDFPAYLALLALAAQQQQTAAAQRSNAPRDTTRVLDTSIRHIDKARESIPAFCTASRTANKNKTEEGKQGHRHVSTSTHQQGTPCFVFISRLPSQAQGQGQDQDQDQAHHYPPPDFQLPAPFLPAPDHYRASCTYSRQLPPCCSPAPCIDSHPRAWSRSRLSAPPCRIPAPCSGRPPRVASSSHLSIVEQQ